MTNRLRELFIATIDLILFNFAFLSAFLLRYDISLFTQKAVQDFSIYRGLIIPICLIRLFAFRSFGLWNWSFRYASLGEALRLFLGVTLGTIAMIAFSAFFYFDIFTAHIGRSILVIDYLLCFFAVSAFRYSFRIFQKIRCKFQNLIRRAPLKRILIAGAGDAGEMVARELLNVYAERYKVIGFVDDDPRKKSLKIHGIHVLGTTEKIPELAKRFFIDEIILAFPSASGNTIRKMIAHCHMTEAKLKIVPSLGKILEGKVDVREIRDVMPEDLLGRPSYKIHGDEVKTLIEGQTVLVTGAGGSIGSELARKIASFTPKCLLLLDIYEHELYLLDLYLKKNFPALDVKLIIGDIQDILLIKNVFSSYRPNLVFHAAAHKHVPLMEDNPAAAVKNNILGTRNLLYAAHHYQCEKFVLISTDKAVNPTSVMGASKRVAEMLLQAKAQKSSTAFMAVRFGNVIGSNGSVVHVFKRQIEEGGPVTVTHPEIKRYFMTVGEAAQLVIQTAVLGKGGEVFILDMGQQIAIADLAKNLITLSGLEPDKDIPIVYTGLRPGEKLYEELLHDREHDLNTRCEKIYIANIEGKYRLNELHRHVRDLKELAKYSTREAISQKLFEIVGMEFHPQNQEKEEAIIFVEKS